MINDLFLLDFKSSIFQLIKQHWKSSAPCHWHRLSNQRCFIIFCVSFPVSFLGLVLSAEVKVDRNKHLSALTGTRASLLFCFYTCSCFCSDPLGRLHRFPFELVTVGTAHTLITLTMALFYFSVPVSQDSMAGSQYAQYYNPETEAEVEFSHQ